MRSLAKIVRVWNAYDTKFCELEVNHSIYDVDIETAEPQRLTSSLTGGRNWVMGKWSNMVNWNLTEGDLVEVEYVDAGSWKVLSNESVTRHMRKVSFEGLLPKDFVLEVGDVLIEKRRSLPGRLYVVGVLENGIALSDLPWEVDRCVSILYADQIVRSYEVWRGKSILDLKG